MFRLHGLAIPYVLEKQMQKPPVIVLNGASSSGKTMIAKAFQEVMDQPVLYVSNDKFIFMVHDRELKDDTVRPKILIPLLEAFHRSIPIIGSCGFPMIIDVVIEREDWMAQLVEHLSPFDTFFVKVECPSEELERREKARGDRKIGLAKWQSTMVHEFCEYDYVLDSHKLSPIENARRLKELFYSGQKPSAFENYRRQETET